MVPPTGRGLRRARFNSVAVALLFLLSGALASLGPNLALPVLRSLSVHPPPPSSGAGVAARTPFAGGGTRVPLVFTYTVTFAEQGLPYGTQWSVTIYLPGGSFDSAGSNTQYATISLANGTYTYSVPPLTAYLAQSAQGSFSVRGAPVGVAVPFSAAPLYPVTFSAVGYPSGTLWTVAISWNDVAASWQSFRFSGQNLTLSLRNDSYSYTVNGPGSYGVDPSAGSFVVAGGPVRIALTFHVGRYGIDFTENGLPAGTNWSVTVNGSTNYSDTPSVICHLGNGTYYFAVGYLPGYWELPRSGVLVIQGSVVAQLVVFTVATFPVTFTETGLPTGTLWTVNFSGEARASTNATVRFSADNGSHAYTVYGISGYALPAYRGTLSVSGTANGTVLAWSEVTYTIAFLELGDPPTASWSVDLNGSVLKTSNASVRFQMPNGTFDFRVIAPSGFAAFPANGSITVRGQGSADWINFTGVPANGPGPFGGANLTYLVLSIAAGAIALAAIAVVVARRRRAPRPPEE